MKSVLKANRRRFFIERWGAKIARGMVIAGLLAGASMAWAGGPRWYAGSTYFDPSVMGQPIVWQNGIVNYYTDPVALSPIVSSSLADQMITTAASLWNSVATAAVLLQSKGDLPQEISGDDVSNGSNGLVEPESITLANAANIPVAVIYDETGEVINAVFGPGTSDPDDCANNAVMTTIDGFSQAGYLTHATMYVNGLCATKAQELPNMEYEMVRGFGRILGLDWSAANDEYITQAYGSDNPDVLAGWPIMHPLEYLCRANFMTPCVANEDKLALSLDDIAALNRMYPVTKAIQSNTSLSYSGKTLTASATFSITGTIHFADGQGMQGVEVELIPAPGGDPIEDYTVSAVSGASFTGMSGNPVNGNNGPQNDPVNYYGSSDQAQEGYFDLSDVPLPTALGNNTTYQLIFLPINPLFIGKYDSVGPYVTSQVSPSGTMPTITLMNVQAGLNLEENVVIGDSANDQHTGIDGSEQSPGTIPATGQWTGRITGYGHTAWFNLWADPNREFTVEAQALDETGAPSEEKLEPVIGLWNGTDAAGSSPMASTTQPFNGDETGLTTLSANTIASGMLRIGIADYRGDGRPDYAYRGRVLYLSSVSPERLPASGGPIVIRGTGFNAAMTVMVNGASAQVTSITPNEIDAVAPASNGTTGAVLLEVEDPATLGVATISDELAYGSQSGDQLAIVTAPSGNIAIHTPETFTVKATDANSSVLANIPVTFTASSGAALLGCSSSTSCTVNTADDGTATVSVEATTAGATQVTAALSNGAKVTAQFTGEAKDGVDALEPDLYLAVGGSLNWTPSVLVLSGGQPQSGASVTWQTISAGLVLTSPATSTTNSQGIATATFSVGPLSASNVGTVNACSTIAQSNDCAVIDVTPIALNQLQLVPVSGAGQRVEASQVLAPLVLKVTDAAGQPVAGATVSFYETEFSWAPPCDSTEQCPAPTVLGQKSVSAVSASDGTVTLTPMRNEEQPANLVINAAVGPSATYTTTLTQYPTGGE